VTASLKGRPVAVPLFAAGRAGGYAEFVTIDAGSLVPLPDGLAFEDAAALMVQGLTALYLIRQCPPRGKAVLITAAVGGVGSLLVQLAKRAGASLVIAAASSRAKLDLAASLGVDICIDYSDASWASRVREVIGGAGADIIYEFVGGAVTETGLEPLAPSGEIVFGALNRFGVGRPELEAMFAKNQSLRGFALLPLLVRVDLARDLADLFDRAVRGELRVIQGGRYRLDQVAEARRVLGSRVTTGKLVLAP